MVKNIINKNVLFYFLFFSFFSCKNEKSKEYENLNSTEYFSIPTDLKNMRNIEKNKINDSLYKIKGLFNNYTIQGYMNGNKKIGWWEALDNNTKEIVAKLEYKFIDNKEFVNQYILYQNGKIDTLKSKFYRVNKNQNCVKYKFYVPYQSKEVHSEGKLYYRYSFQGKINRHLESKGFKNKNVFECIVSVPVNSKENDLIIEGNFWEMFQLENGEISGNDIYVSDTLK